MPLLSRLPPLSHLSINRVSTSSSEPFQLVCKYPATLRCEYPKVYIFRYIGRTQGHPMSVSSKLSSQSEKSSISRADTSPNRLGKRIPDISRPSSSILLISPTNQILLLHRVNTASSFADVHVFPGGNLSSSQDGEIPPPEHSMRHQDSMVYRLGAIRECFEETGILLAKKLTETSRLLELEDDVREEGRRAVHQNKVNFLEWLKKHGGCPDTDGLKPFTRWVTPLTVPKRFTTQMYLYFLPISELNADSTPGLAALQIQRETLIPKPTSDGGIEHTSAQFRRPSEWLSMYKAGKIILFPPQFLLLHLTCLYLSPNSEHEELIKKRTRLLDFVETGNPPWSEKCISPSPLHGPSKYTGMRTVMDLSKPGYELQGGERRGETDIVLLADTTGEQPRNLEIAQRHDFVQQLGELGPKI